MSLMASGSIPEGMKVSYEAVLKHCDGDKNLAEIIFEGASNDGLEGWAVPLEWLIPVDAPSQHSQACEENIQTFFPDQWIWPFYSNSKVGDYIEWTKDARDANGNRYKVIDVTHELLEKNEKYIRVLIHHP